MIALAIPSYVNNLTTQELKAWYILRQIKPTGMLSQIIVDTPPERARELLQMLIEQIIDGNSEQLREILGPKAVMAIEAC